MSPLRCTGCGTRWPHGGDWEADFDRTGAVVAAWCAPCRALADPDASIRLWPTNVHEPVGFVLTERAESALAEAAVPQMT